MTEEGLKKQAKQEAIEMVHKFRKVGCASTPEAELRSAKQSAYMSCVAIRKTWEEISRFDCMNDSRMAARVRNKIIYYQELAEQILSIPG